MPLRPVIDARRSDVLHIAGVRRVAGDIALADFTTPYSVTPALALTELRVTPAEEQVTVLSVA
jgi:hypothetical protein